MATRRPRYRLRASRILLATLILAAGMAADPSFSHAQGEDDGCVEVNQAHRTWTVDPVSGDEAPEAFYAYRDFRSHNPLIRERASVLFFYSPSGRSCGDLSLFMLHHADQASHTRFTISGVPESTSIQLKDDPDDAYWLSPPSLKVNWRWSASRTDGAVLGGLRGDVRLMVRPEFDEAIRTWYVVGGSASGPSFIELPNLSDLLRLRFSAPDPVARFEMSPASPTVGQDVRFDASGSASAQSEIVRYRWDFNEDGAFELVRDSPVVTHRFPTASPHYVTLEVVDAAGRTGQASRSFDVHGGEFSVERTVLTHLPNHQALPGSALTIELRLRAHSTVSGVGIRETTPEGWTIEPGSTRGWAYNASQREWLLLETLRPGEERRLQYRLVVPDGAVLQAYEIDGRAVSSSPEFEMAIGGEGRIDVIGVLPAELAVSRLSTDGAIDVTLSNLITLDQILQAVALWQADTPVPGTNGKRLDLAMMSRLVAYWLNDRPVTEPLP